MRITTKLEGFENFKKELEQLKRSDIKTAAYSGSAGGAKMVRDNAKQNVMNHGLFETGALHKGIIMKKEKEAGISGLITYIVAVRHGKARTKKQRVAGQDPYYWMFWEFGTRRNQKRPFMVPALAAHRQAVSEKIAGNMRKKLLRNKLIK